MGDSWYSRYCIRCRLKKSLLISPQPAHFNFICTIELFSFLRIILIWPAVIVSSHLSTLTVSEIGKRFRFVSVSLRKIEVFLLLSLTVNCETKRNEKL